MPTGNPALNAQIFADSVDRSGVEKPMTIQGTVGKSVLSLALVIAGAVFTWREYYLQDLGLTSLLMIVGGIGGFIVAMVTIFNKTWSPVTTPIYAVLEGLALGGISAQTDAAYPGVAIQAISLTFATLLALLTAYQCRLIQATEHFKAGVIAATGGICIVYVASLLLGFSHIQIPGIFGNGWIGIGFSVFVVIMAALNLVLDFDFIEQGAAEGAPKYMEWYGAFGLMVTLVWLYLEVIRLLAKIRSRD